ncbi:MAG: hypothetical protein ACTHMD_13670 [Flavisolibacter sp.]
MEEKRNATDKEGAGGIGRNNFIKGNQSDKQNIENKNRDVTSIDREEGTMNHGVIGGGLPDNSNQVNENKND